MKIFKVFRLLTYKKRSITLQGRDGVMLLFTEGLGIFLNRLRDLISWQIIKFTVIIRQRFPINNITMNLV